VLSCEQEGAGVRARSILVGINAVKPCSRALNDLRDAGCKRVYLNGSFVTSKDEPGDFDACWDPTGVDFERIEPTLLEFENARAAQKARYGGELFPADWDAIGDGTILLCAGNDWHNVPRVFSKHPWRWQKRHRSH
jgi:hypothetical protein